MTSKLLVTGANGKVGTAFVSFLDSSDFESELVLADLEPRDERSIAVDVMDPAACERACRGVSVVVHLAGIASPEADFDALLSANIVGTQNMFAAASTAGVKRVVYASSAQAVEGYPLDVQVHSNLQVRPKNLYGVSKAFGEALGAYYAYQKGLEVIAVRIGAFEYPENWKLMGARDLSAWVEPNDLCHLLRLCVEAELGDCRYLIAHGISNNRYKRLDLSETKSRLGYSPQADAFSTWRVPLETDSRPRRPKSSS